MVDDSPPAEILWDGQQALGAELMGVCEERNIIWGILALSTRQVPGLVVPFSEAE